MDNVVLQSIVGEEVQSTIARMGYDDGVAMTAYNYAVHGLNYFNLLIPLIFALMGVTLMAFLCRFIWWGDKKDLDGAFRALIGLFLATNLWQLVYALGWVLPWSPTAILLLIFALFVGWSMFSITDIVSSFVTRSGKVFLDVLTKVVSEEFKGTHLMAWFSGLHKDTRRLALLALTLVVCSIVLHLFVR